jgi:transposase-like protein
MIPYSQDLRERILETVQRGDGSLRQIARRFLVRGCEKIRCV